MSRFWSGFLATIAVAGGITGVALLGHYLHTHVGPWTTIPLVAVAFGVLVGWLYQVIG